MVFDPLKYDFAAEGGGSRRARPAVLPRPNYGVAGPSGAIFRDTPQQAARDPRPQQIRSLVEDVPDGSTGPSIVDDGEGGDTVSRTFNPYPTTLPPLSPQMLAALEQRRAASLRQLQEAEAQVESQRQQAELANVGRLLGIEEETGRERREGMTELASRGVARSPLFANPFRRELARQQQQQIAESQQTLANTLDQLQSVLQGARQRRESELAQIAFETAQQRSSVPRLLGLE